MLLRALLLPCVVVGCTPDVDPPWLVERPTELALSITVETLGRYSEPPGEPTREYHEALPLDTVLLEPFVVDRGGPIPLEELSVRWVACPTVGCIDAIAEADRLPPCATAFDPLSSCSIGETPSVSLPLPDFPPGLDELSLFTLAAAPSVAFVASRAGEPGVDVCVARLRAREPLGPCVMMLRDVELGSLADLAAAAETAGISVDFGEGSEELLLVPRNLAPLVKRFSVSGSSLHAAGEVASRSTVPVAKGDEIQIAYLPDEADFDREEIIVDDVPLTLEDTLAGQWWLDRHALAFTSGDLQARWTVSGESGTAYIYFVVRDGRGSEAWGWLVFEVSA